MLRQLLFGAQTFAASFVSPVPLYLAIGYGHKDGVIITTYCLVARRVLRRDHILRRGRLAGKNLFKLL